MSKKSRHIAAAAGLGTMSLGLALAAPAVAGGTASATPSHAGLSGSINVVMAQYSSLTAPYWKSLVKAFEQKYPSIHVALRVIDWNTLLQQVPTMIQTHTQPDILNFNNYSTYASAGLLFPAMQVLSAQVEADFFPAFKLAIKPQSGVVASSWRMSSAALLVTSRIFASRSRARLSLAIHSL